MEFGGLRQPVAHDTNERRRYLLAQSDVFEDNPSRATSTRTAYRQRRHDADESALLGNDNRKETFDGNHDFPGQEVYAIRLASRVKIWPPWPLSLLGKTSEEEEDGGAVTAANTYPSAVALFWAYFRQRARIGVRQFQEIGSQVSETLP
jgi:hypothetical protein